MEELRLWWFVQLQAQKAKWKLFQKRVKMKTLYYYLVPQCLMELHKLIPAARGRGAENIIVIFGAAPQTSRSLPPRSASVRGAHAFSHRTKFPFQSFSHHHQNQSIRAIGLLLFFAAWYEWQTTVLNAEEVLGTKRKKNRCQPLRF
jgi:hypothetical protein